MKTQLNHGCAYRVVFISALLFILAGCSSNPGAATGNPSAHAAETGVYKADDGSLKVIDFAGREVVFPKPPVRVVSLVPADLEIVRALGGEIVGRPTVSDEVTPAGLEDVMEVGTAHDMDFEKIVSLRPDLVIGHADLNIKDAGTMESLGMKLLLTRGDSFEEIVDATELYGQLMEREDEAAELVASMEEKKAAIEPLSEEVKALIVFGSAESFMAALPDSLSGNLLKLTGGVNIAEGLPGIERYPGYAQLSMERVLQGNPDIIFFIAHGDPQALKTKFEEELKSNTAWSNVNAVKNNRLIILPPDLFSSSPGPRVIEALEYLHNSLSDVVSNGAAA